MRVVSFTEARNGLNQVLNQIEDDADFTIIHPFQPVVHLRVEFAPSVSKLKN